MLEPEFVAGGNKRHMVLEGGSIDVNGRGLLLTTEDACSARRSNAIREWAAKKLSMCWAAFWGQRR